MKLTVLGGGGIRSPLLVAAAVRIAERVCLDEICLMDINEEKLGLLGSLCQQIALRSGSGVRVTTTTDARQALERASYIITTIRVGEEQGRVYDERIALRHNVLGQETTGPGGFAMAMRSIPVLLEYASLAYELCPGAWILNFTNPAGLVTQALVACGFKRVIGICDGANQAQAEAARWLRIEPARLRADVFGLNHLSWTRRLFLDGKDILPDLIADDAFLASTSQRMFDPSLIRSMQMWLNEYLYYYYYSERALRSIQADSLTRGEEVMQINRKLLDKLRSINPHRDPEAAIAVYNAYERRRTATYMHYAYLDGGSLEETDQVYTGSSVPAVGEDEGYAGVALNIIAAMENQTLLHTALNIPNQGSIECLRSDDVVEISCLVEKDGCCPQPVGAVPEPQELLMRSVKRYERLAVEAILKRSRELATLALMAHPLVLDYSLSKALVDEYLAAHASFTGEWS